MRTSLIAAAILSLTALHPALADPGQFAGVICDTETQAADFASRWDGTNGAQLLSEINAEAGKTTACIIGIWLMDKESEGPEVTTDMGTWKVFPTTVLAKFTPTGMVPSAVPLPQFFPQLVEKSQKTLDLFPQAPPASAPIYRILPRNGREA